MSAIVLRLKPVLQRLKDVRLCAPFAPGVRRVTGLSILRPASATARAVPRRRLPMIETSGFRFLFLSGIGIVTAKLSYLDAKADPPGQEVVFGEQPSRRTCAS